MNLRGRPSSPPAHALVDSLLRETVLPHAKKAPGGKTALKLRQALGALLCDLMRVQATSEDLAPSCGFHGTSPKDFTVSALGFGRTTFLDVVGALEAGGLLTVAVGQPRWHTFSSTISQGGGLATTYRLNPAALELAASHGVDTAAWGDHWIENEPAAPGEPSAPGEPLILLKSGNRRIAGEKLKGAMMPVDFSDPVVARMQAEMEEINAFLLAQEITGIHFRGMRRIFNDGDQDGFRWQWGGRFFSIPGGVVHESLGGETRRKRIKINGEAVGEVDISASHLTLYHALLGEPFDTSTDPYAAAGWDRELLKRWTAHAFGAGTTGLTRWGKEAVKHYQTVKPGGVLKDDYPIKAARNAMLARHPTLRRLESTGLSSIEIQFHETEILKGALAILRKRHGVPALPVHDSLVVPGSKLAAAKAALEEAFSAYIATELKITSAITPMVKLKDAGEIREARA